MRAERQWNEKMEMKKSKIIMSVQFSIKARRMFYICSVFRV